MIARDVIAMGAAAVVSAVVLAEAGAERRVAPAEDRQREIAVSAVEADVVKADLLTPGSAATGASAVDMAGTGITDPVMNRLRWFRGSSFRSSQTSRPWRRWPA